MGPLRAAPQRLVGLEVGKKKKGGGNPSPVSGRGRGGKRREKKEKGESFHYPPVRFLFLRQGVGRDIFEEGKEKERRVPLASELLFFVLAPTGRGLEEREKGMERAIRPSPHYRFALVLAHRCRPPLQKEGEKKEKKRLISISMPTPARTHLARALEGKKKGPFAYSRLGPARAPSPCGRRGEKRKKRGEKGKRRKIPAPSPSSASARFFRKGKRRKKLHCF